MKSPLYLTTTAAPPLEGTDAVFQDIQRLQSRFGGAHINLFPFATPSRFVPQWCLGWTQLSTLREAAESASLLHVFSPTLRPLPVLTRLDRPIIYSVTAAVPTRPRVKWFNKHGVHIIANNARDHQRLVDAGAQYIVQILPGIYTQHLTAADPMPQPPFRLLIGSAPWTRGQFRSKGIDALIALAANTPDLHLIFLWRQLHTAHLREQIRRAGIEDRTTIIDQKVDVNDWLARCHATTVLATNERLVKAWPHSAIESLAAGRPVLLSACIPMSAYAKDNGCGIAVKNFDALPAAFDELRQLTVDAITLQKNVRQDFDPEQMLERVNKTYLRAIK